jgi:adenylate cyclase
VETFVNAIWLNTGLVTAGNMGTRKVLNYTIMGDTVNLGARLESANKQYGTNIMIGESTYELTKDKFDTRRLDYIRVKGKEKGVYVYELLGPINSITPERAEQIRLYESAFEEYLKTHFETAIQLLDQALIISDDKPSETLKSRCEEYLKSPPESDWDGIYTMTSK